MSGATTATYVAAAVAAAATYTSYEQSKKASAMQERAMQQAKENAGKQEKLQEEATNRANGKNPDVGAMLSATQQAAKAGGSSTMLTGPSGIDPAALQLGKNTLLGS